MSDTNGSRARKPAIVAPLSRYLAVAEIARSIAFYRDLLGFDVGSVRDENGVPAEVEVRYGPALIQLAVRDSAPDSTGAPRPRGSAILFFQTDDVAVMRDAVTARGGKPSELEKVNWIKMRMFDIKDPDGHTLWFGQSFQQPDSPRASEYQLRKIIPSLPLSDVPACVAYYRDVLGFKVNYAQDDIGVMDRDEVTILLIARTDLHTGIGSCYVYIRDAETLHAELAAKGANVQREPVSHPSGLRDFEVRDLEGNQITFGQTFE
jgi:catechol 2,3-dioxygenase-like lactoylglutathione lyase family enzyme